MTHAVPGRDKPADTRGTQPRPVQPKPPPRAHLNPAAAMALQRQAGNRAVTNLVTPQEPVVQRGILDDVASVAGDVKGRVLGQFGTWARRIPGYGVLCVALGKDPITEQPVARDATAVVGALVGLVPGGAALWENLQQSGAVAKAGEWLAAELPKLGLTWESIRSLFSRAWDAVSVTDLIDPGAVWDRLSGIFSAPIARLRAFAAAAGTKLMELVFEGVLGGAGGIGGQVMGIIHRAGDVLGTIVRDPIGFAGNLVTAVRGGLGQFVGNVMTHLRTGLFGWLTGALRGAVQIPQRFDFGGILSMVASMLGLTWSWLRERLVRTLGERTVHLVETGVDWVRDIATRGMAAVSQRLSDMASGFVDTVIGGIRDWVANSIVGAAITRLISMFNPAGAVIQAILAVYNTIRFFIERAQQLGALAESVFGSIAAIASGSLDAAKNAVESALGRAVPVVLGFLARLIGLGDVAAPVRNIITRIRGAVDRAADRVIGWVSGAARRLTGRGGAPGDGPEAGRERTDAEKVAAVDGAVAAVQEMAGRGAGREELDRALPGIKNRFGLTAVELLVENDELSVRATINPSKKAPAQPPLLPSQLRLPPTYPLGGVGSAVDPTLPQMAMSWRAGTALTLDSFKANYAVFRIKHGTQVIYEGAHNDANALHSEAKLLQLLQSLGGPFWYRNGYIIDQVYTERRPCTESGTGNCSHQLQLAERLQRQVDPSAYIAIYYTVLSSTRGNHKQRELMDKYRK